MAINEYRRHAAYCLSIADNAVNLENKVSLLGLAETWLELARRAEQADLDPPLNRGLPPSGQHSRGFYYFRGGHDACTGETSLARV
jgi:hypothetical protein